MHELTTLYGPYTMYTANTQYSMKCTVHSTVRIEQWLIKEDTTVCHCHTHCKWQPEMKDIQCTLYVSCKCTHYTFTTGCTLYKEIIDIKIIKESSVTLIKMVILLSCTLFTVQWPFDTDYN